MASAVWSAGLGACSQWDRGGNSWASRAKLPPKAERICIINCWVLWWRFNLYPLLPLIHDKCQGPEKPSHHSICVMHFKVVVLTSTDSYFLRKEEIERSETGAKPWSGVRGQGRSPLQQNVNHYSFQWLQEVYNVMAHVLLLLFILIYCELWLWHSGPTTEPFIRYILLWTVLWHAGPTTGPFVRYVTYFVRVIGAHECARRCGVVGSG